MDKINIISVIVYKDSLKESNDSGKMMLSAAIEKEIRKNHRIICGSSEFRIMLSPRHFVLSANADKRLWKYFLIIQPNRTPIKITTIGLPQINI